MKTLREKIEVMEAAERGEKIEFAQVQAHNWQLCVGQPPAFNWRDCDYRVAPTKTYTVEFTEEERDQLLHLFAGFSKWTRAYNKLYSAKPKE